jgi:hypothetical protein
VDDRNGREIERAGSDPCPRTVARQEAERERPGMAKSVSVDRDQMPGAAARQRGYPLALALARRLPDPALNHQCDLLLGDLFVIFIVLHRGTLGIQILGVDGILVNELDHFRA